MALLDEREQVEAIAVKAARAAVREVADEAAQRAVEAVLGQDLHDVRSVARAWRTVRRTWFITVASGVVGYLLTIADTFAKKLGLR